MKLKFDKNKNYHYLDSIVRKSPERFLVTDSGIKTLASIGIKLGSSVKRSHLLSLVQKGIAYPIEHEFSKDPQSEIDFNLDQGEFDYLPRCEETGSVYELSLVVLKDGNNYTTHLFSPELVVIKRKAAINIIPLFLLTSNILNRIVEHYSLDLANPTIVNIKRWYSAYNAEKWDNFYKEQSMRQGTFDFDENKNDLF